MKTLLSALMISWLGLGLAGCNTTAGLGQDIEATGEAIENAAEKTEEALEGG